MSKKILLAAPRGYCAGVDRAVVAVEKSLELYGAPVYVRKEIVHNKHVVSTLEQRGVIFVNETDEVPEGATVVFSAHGVSPAVHAEAAARNLKTIDATCPLVTKVHNEVKRFANEETEILLIGHVGHEEVEGTAGEAPGKVRVVDGLDEARTIQPTPGKKLVWLSQTTLSCFGVGSAPAPISLRWCSTIYHKYHRYHKCVLLWCGWVRRREALRKAGAKLPVKTKVVSRIEADNV